jgi:glutaredoxin
MRLLSQAKETLVAESKGRVLVCLAALLVAATPASAAKLYKWVDSNGKVHYTDQPPPADAKTQERKKFGDKAIDATLPYSLQQAMKNFPVTLYSSDCGDTCTKASAYLDRRGVPFADKNARDAAIADELKALTGGKLEIPVLKIGGQLIRGYSEASWKTALDAAGYPSSPVTAVRPKVAAKPASVPERPAEPAGGGVPERSEGAPTTRQ